MIKKLLLATLLASSSCFATTWNFSFSGGRQNFTTETGSGSFSYSGGLSAATLADLSSFNLTYTWNDYYNNIGPITYNYSLADLISFSMTDSSNNVTSLTATNNNFKGGLAAVPLGDFDFFTYGDSILLVTSIDTVVYPTFSDPPDSSVPEPSLLVASLAFLFILVRKRKRRF